MHAHPSPTSPVSRLIAQLALAVVALTGAAAFGQVTYTPYTISTLAGSPGANGYVDDTGSNARFSYPSGVAVDSSGNVYVADGHNSAVRKVTSAGVTGTLATSVTSGSGTGTPFGNLGGIAIDPAGQNLYVSDYTSGAIYKITLAGVSTMFFAGGTISHPGGLAVDSSGNVYVADTGSYVIRKITSAGASSVLAGQVGVSGFANGTGTGAQFGFPLSVALDGSGNLYVVDSQYDVIRKVVVSSGAVSTFAGITAGPGTVDGPIGSAMFNTPTGIGIDSSGDLFVTDSRQMVREITAGGTVTSLAGSTTRGGSTNGTGSSALFQFAYPTPAGIAVGSNGTIYVADTGNDTVRSGVTSVSTPPTITTQPLTQSVTVGTSVTLSVVVTGTGPFTYQWNAGGGAISGATSASYTISNFQPGNAGTYQVIVTGAGGTAFSNYATLTALSSAPTITTQPQSQSAAAGSSVTLSVIATGAGTLTYQWSFGSTAISGATSASYTISNFQTGNAGSYTVAVTGSGGTTVSNAATVSLSGGPTITTQPVTQTDSAGANTTLSVAATGGTAPLSYQWYENGVAIAGATGSSLSFSDLGVTQAGSYTVKVTDANNNTVTSSAAALGVTYNARLVNLSILSNISGSLSMGFVNGGAGTSGSEPLLIRAVGPSIGPGTTFNVPGIMPDPTLAVVQQTNNSVSYKNSGWGTPSSNVAPVQAADTATGAFPLTVTASLDSALVTSLPPVSGGYSATVAGASGDGGYALTKVYDDTANYVATSPRLVNLSCLTSIAATGTLDVGFVVNGTTSETLLVRVTGPALIGSPFNQTGTMPDPKLSVHPSNVSAYPTAPTAANAGWGGNAQITAADSQVGAFALTNSASKDSAVLVTVSPGVPYAVEVSSVTGASGTVLVEIYEVP